MPKQSIPIELGGKTRHLRYTFNALVALEDKLGVPISKIGDMLTGSVSVKNLRTLIWAGLIHEDGGLTPKKVGEWLDFSMLSDIIGKFTEAFEASFPDDSDTKNVESPKVKAEKKS